MPAYWLLKSEPGVYGLADLRRNRVTDWDGVRNYRARNFLLRFRRGDLALFYHSGSAPAVAGTMTVIRSARPDPTQFDPRGERFDPRATRARPRWFQVRVRFRSAFRRPVPLATVRSDPGLKGMALLAHTRLSVTPVRAAEWARIVKLGG